MNIHMKKSEAGLVSHHMQKLTQKAQRLKHKAWNCKTPRRKYWGKHFNIGFDKEFFKLTPKQRQLWSKNKVKADLTSLQNQMEVW